jgi:L-rhamnose-H+ transport protein
MEQFTAILIVILAGIFQGSFILPMTLVKQWKWENTWLVFSFLGMIVLNFLLAAIFIRELSQVYATIPFKDLMLACPVRFRMGHWRSVVRNRHG